MNPIELLILSQRKARRDRCPRCGGNGKVNEYWYRGGQFIPMVINCPLCNRGDQNANKTRTANPLR